MPQVLTEVNNALGGITADDLAGIITGVTSLVPVVIGPVVGMIALRKGFSFLKSQMKGA